MDFISSLLEGNALLWYISCQEGSVSFNNWQQLKEALAKTFGPLRSAEESRLAYFSLCQDGSLENYIRDFTMQATVKSYAEEHQSGISLGNKNIFSLQFCPNKNIDFDSGKTSKV